MSKRHSTYLEVRVEVPLGFEELVLDTLRGERAWSAEIDGVSDSPQPPPGRARVCLFLPEEEASAVLLNTLQAELGRLPEETGLPELAGLVPRVVRHTQADWTRAWREQVRPFRVGRLVLVPPWSTPALRPSDVPLVLEPGGAFGSGRHPTTRVCLRRLQRRLVPGERLLDAGTGNGVLAVAAALLGAAEVFAFDLDPNSLPYAEVLARENHVTHKLRVVQGAVACLDSEAAPFDGALANIYHDVLCAEASRLARSLRLGGWFVFSGVHRSHHPVVRQALDEAGLRVEAEHRTGKWTTFEGVRAG